MRYDYSLTDWRDGVWPSWYGQTVECPCHHHSYEHQAVLSGPPVEPRAQWYPARKVTETHCRAAAAAAPSCGCGWQSWKTGGKEAHNISQINVTFGIDWILCDICRYASLATLNLNRCWVNSTVSVEAIYRGCVTLGYKMWKYSVVKHRGTTNYELKNDHRVETSG